VLAIARAGAQAGCTEALFTLGDRPEARYRVCAGGARRARLRDDARVPRALRERVLEETGLLPHLNPGVMTATSSPRCGRSPRRWGSCSRRRPSGSRRAAARTGPLPTKNRPAGLETIRLAGELSIPFTSGILVGIGETRVERIDALLALRSLAEEHGTSGRSSSRTSARRRARGCPTIPTRRWRSTSGRSPPPGSCSARLYTSRRRRTSPTRTSHSCSMPGIDDWAVCRRWTVDHVNPGRLRGPEVERAARVVYCRSRGLALAPPAPRSTRSTSPSFDRWASGQWRLRSVGRRTPTGFAPARIVVRPRAVAIVQFLVASRSAPVGRRRWRSWGEEAVVRLFAARVGSASAC
jgi:hypothetical protein